MVADTLAVFCDHQQIQGVLAILGVVADDVDQRGSDLHEIAVHHIVMLHDGVCQIQILSDIGVNSFTNHLHGGFCHLTDLDGFPFHTAVQVGDDLGDVLGLVADTLHVGDHLHGCGDLAQVTGHGLLLEQELQAQGFNGALGLVNICAQGGDTVNEVILPTGHGLGHQLNDLLTLTAHPGHFPVQLGKLIVKMVSHSFLLNRICR